MLWPSTRLPLARKLSHSRVLTRLVRGLADTSNGEPSERPRIRSSRRQWTQP